MTISAKTLHQLALRVLVHISPNPPTLIIKPIYPPDEPVTL
jgi:hypothetical protein